MDRHLSPYDRAYLDCGYYPDKETGKAPDPEELTSDQLISVYIDLHKANAEAKAYQKRVAASVAELEPLVVKHFQDEGKQRDTRRGRTVYIAEEEWPKIEKEDLLETLPPDATKDQRKAIDERARNRLIEALRNDPLTEHLVKATYNATTLRSFILHDCERDPETFERVIPEHLEGVLGVSVNFRAKVLKS